MNLQINKQILKSLRQLIQHIFYLIRNLYVLTLQQFVIEIVLTFDVIIYIKNTLICKIHIS